MKTLKVIVVIAFVVFFTFITSSLGYSSDARPKSSLSGERVFIPARATDTEDLHMAGVDVSTYQYVEVYQYVVVHTQTLFVLGRTRSNEIVLSSIHVNDNAFTSIAQYPIRSNFPITHVQFTIFSMHRLESAYFYIMVTYTENNSGMRVELTSTIIEVFRYESHDIYQLVNREKIERTNISHFPEPDSPYKYLYYNYTPESVGKIIGILH